MNSLWLTIECFALALGGAYLWLKHRDRLRRWVPSNDPKKWTGHGINALELKPRIDNVRRDYLAARSVAKRVCFHRVLLRLARRAVSRLGYFRHRQLEP